MVEEKKAAVRAGEASIEKGKGKDLLSMVGKSRIPKAYHAGPALDVDFVS